MKRFKPNTPGRRGMTGINYRELLSGDKPEKSLTKPIKKTGGRSRGQISVRHRGGGAKRRWRSVDFKRADFDILAKVETIEYDPSRTSFIAKILYKNGKRAYIIASQNMKVGDEVVSSQKRAPIKPGNRMPLKFLPSGTAVYNVELNPGQGGKLIRSAGSSAQVMAREAGFVHLKMPSSEVRRINENSLGTVGEISNPENRMVTIGKAGRNRWRGKRPTVRGTAMNPVDHPHGGGEGRAPVGLRRSKNLWGKGIRGVKTRKKRKPTNVFIVKKRKTKKRR